MGTHIEQNYYKYKSLVTNYPLCQHLKGWGEEKYNG